jgi:hypothetical protein
MVMPLLKPAILLTLVAAGPVGFLDGNKLLGLCELTYRPAQDICIAYVQGVADEWRFADFLDAAGEGKDPKVCAPEANSRQLADAVVNYLKAHPEERNQPAANLVMSSIMEAWHCK